MSQVFEVCRLSGGLLEYAEAKAMRLNGVEYDNYCDKCDYDNSHELTFAPLKNWKHYGMILHARDKQRSERITITPGIENKKPVFSLAIIKSTGCFVGTGESIQEAACRARVLETFGKHVELSSVSVWYMQKGDSIRLRCGGLLACLNTNSKAETGWPRSMARLSMLFLALDSRLFAEPNTRIFVRCAGKT